MDDDTESSSSHKKRALFSPVEKKANATQSGFIAAFENVRELKEIVRNAALTTCTTSISNSIQSYIHLKEFHNASIMCKVLEEHCKQHQLELDAKANYRKGVVYMNLKDKLKEAIDCFTLALKQSPQDNAVIQKLKEAKTKYQNEKKKHMKAAKAFFGAEEENEN